MTPSLAFKSAITEIETDLIRLRLHLNEAKSYDFCPATLGKLQANMTKVGDAAKRIVSIALDAELECLMEDGE